MKVAELMTPDVVTVDPETTLKDAAVLLASRRISGLPVVDGHGRVAGVLSEADILVKEAGQLPQSRLLGRLRAGAQQRLEARTAGEAMTVPAVTVSPETGVAEAARLMVERHVNRLPVVDGAGTLVGIVTRADLVRVFVRADAEIERELRDDVVLGALWIDPAAVEISVRQGEVTLAGELDTRADARLLESFAARVPGVVSLESRLRWRRDEPSLSRSQPFVPVPPRR